MHCALYGLSVLNRAIDLDIIAKYVLNSDVFLYTMNFQVAVLEANANRAAAEAADEITRLQAEKLMTDALISGQQEALLSELDSIGLTTGRLLNRTSSLLKYH